MIDIPNMARSLGLRRSGREYRGRCPACGYADAFALTVRNARPVAWCHSCQDRVAIAAVLRREGKPPAEGPKRSSASSQSRCGSRPQSSTIWLRPRGSVDGKIRGAIPRILSCLAAHSGIAFMRSDRAVTPRLPFVDLYADGL